MFEEEAEEYKDNTKIKDENTYIGFPNERISELQDFEGNYIDISERIIKAFKDGAEFGYNKAKEDADKMKSRFLELCNLKDMRIAELEKANEWHYVKDGNPKNENDILCRISKDEVVVGYYHSAKKRYITIDGQDLYNIIAWKEIVLPELKDDE